MILYVMCIHIEKNCLKCLIKTNRTGPDRMILKMHSQHVQNYLGLFLNIYNAFSPFEKEIDIIWKILPLTLSE